MMDNNKIINTDVRITLYYIWELLTEMAKAMRTDDMYELKKVIDSQKEPFEHEKKCLAVTAINDILELLEAKMDEKDDE